MCDIRQAAPTTAKSSIFVGTTMANSSMTLVKDSYERERSERKEFARPARKERRGHQGCG
jgi:hypothetical protein